MTSSWKCVTQRMFLAVCSALLVVLLAACGGVGTTGNSATPASPPTATPSPTPTPAVTTVYTGSGYTISYPQDWKQSTNAIGIVFADAQGGKNAFSIIVAPNPGGATQPSTLAQATLTDLVKEGNLTGTSPASVSATVSLAGETWEQQGTTGTINESGVNVPEELIVLATNHPASSADTTIYELIYGGPMVSSTLLDQQIFQAMLASFQFTS